MSKQPLLTVADLADLLNVTERHVRRLVHERRIDVVRVGRLIRFDPRAIDRWLTANTSKEAAR